MGAANLSLKSMLTGQWMDKGDALLVLMRQENLQEVCILI